MNRHAYWSAGSFIASCFLAGAVLAASFVGLGEWLHDRLCPCDVLP